MPARGVERGVRDLRLRVLVAPAGRPGLLRVAAGQLGPRTATARELTPTATALLLVARGSGLLRRYGTAAATEGVLRRGGARGLQTLRGTRRLTAEPGARTGRGRPALRRSRGAWGPRAPPGAPGRPPLPVPGSAARGP